MTAARLSEDTSPDVERRQIEGWRGMTPGEKAATVTALTSTAIALTMAGIRHRHPGEAAEVHRMRLAEILYGHDQARRLFPHVDPPR